MKRTIKRIEVVLLSNVDKLGRKNDIISVTAGYFRNYLLPNNLALIADKGQKTRIEKEYSEKSEKLKKSFKALKAKIEDAVKEPLKFFKKPGLKGGIYGSVTKDELRHSFEEKLGHELPTRVYSSYTPIKEIGESKFEFTMFDHKFVVPVEVLKLEAEKKAEEK